MSILTCIVKLKDVTFDSTDDERKEKLRVLAAEVKAVFGKGGNDTEGIIVEERIGITNTPITNEGYVRSWIDESFGTALEYINDNGGSEHADLIRVEWEGQEMFEVGKDAEGNPEYLGMIAV